MAKLGREAKKRRGKGPKIAVVGEVTQLLKDGHGFLLAKNNGLTYGQATALRATARKNDVAIKVVKNTLLRRALEQAGIDPEPLKGLLKQETLVAIGKKDPVTPAKLLTEFISQNEGKLEIKGGFLDGNVLSSSDVDALSKLPSREELIARMLGSMQAPIQKVVFALNAAVAKPVYAVDAYRRKLEEGNAA